MYNDTSIPVYLSYFLTAAQLADNIVSDCSCVGSQSCICLPVSQELYQYCSSITRLLQRWIVFWYLNERSLALNRKMEVISKNCTNIVRLSLQSWIVYLHEQSLAINRKMEVISEYCINIVHLSLQSRIGFWYLHERSLALNRKMEVISELYHDSVIMLFENHYVYKSTTYLQFSTM